MEKAIEIAVYEIYTITFIDPNLFFFQIKVGLWWVMEYLV